MDNYLTRISELKRLLGDEGYYPSQLDEIIKGVIGRKEVAGLSDQQGQELVDELEYYYNFSKRCRDNIGE